MAKIVVVGKATDCTHYCGRRGSYKGIGKDMSILANPFVLKDEAQRDEVCDKYQELFDSAEHREVINIALNEILDDYKSGICARIVLGCFCKPKRCHCDTIAKHLNDELQKELEW